MLVCMCVSTGVLVRLSVCVMGVCVSVSLCVIVYAYVCIGVSACMCCVCFCASVCVIKKLPSGTLQILLKPSGLDINAVQMWPAESA